MPRLRAWGKSLWMAETGMARTGSAEASGDAAVAVADAVMDGAMDAAMEGTRDEATAVMKCATKGGSAARSRALPGLRLRAFPPQSLRERKNQAGPSSSDRRRDTSRSCFRENQSPNTGE
jgi:hypothetical protein